jgi:hypothetical protein
MFLIPAVLMPVVAKRIGPRGRGPFLWRVLMTVLIAVSVIPASYGLELRASQHGVVADGATNNAEAIQALIDRCAAEGGGRVIIDGGVVVSGMITLKTAVTLEIDEGATLMNTGIKEDYPFVPVDFPSYYPERRAMVYARNAENIAIVGKGTIDGKSSAYRPRSSESDRVSLIRLDGCRNVVVKDLTLRNASMWTQHFYRCDDVDINGLTIRNYLKNDDGLNVDGCHRVTIRNCDISSHDDAITLKATSTRDNRDVLVENCRLKTVKSAFKFGTETHAGFINVTARDLDIEGGRDAIALLCTDGGRIENILLEDIWITESKCPIFIYHGRRLRQIDGVGEVTDPGRIDGITIRNLRATGAGRPILISGLESEPIANLHLESINISVTPEAPKERKNKKSKKARQEAEKRTLQANETGYPSSAMFGALNAWGLILRHVDSVKLDEVEIVLEGETTLPKHYLENVSDVSLPVDF